MSENGGSGGVIGGRPGTTIQYITLKGQMLGIIIPWLLMIFGRLLFWLIMFFTVLMGGEHLSTWIALSIVFYLFWGNRSIPGSKIIPVLLVTATVLGLLATFDYWPTLVQWGRLDGRMSYRVHWGATWDSWLGSRLAIDTGWLIASWGVVWLRVLSTILLPSIIWLPSRVADWALGSELVAPQFRELFTPRYVDVESMPYPDGYNPRSVRRAPPSDQDETEPEVVRIPQPRRRGGDS